MRRVDGSKQNICHMNVSRGINFDFGIFFPLSLFYLFIIIFFHTRQALTEIPASLLWDLVWQRRQSSFGTCKSQLIEQV